ncbi:peptidoglycan recognition protein family protein [Streptomyces chartreusis]|uniref:peptidoglycan recognition protein family protein n=1 Tax=Streptomyces chartreusis TaxID=1969 RepID=UPI0038132BA8
MATPLTATQLLAALKAEGCKVREVRSWRTHNRNAVGAWGPVNGVMIHHTATGPGVDVVGLIYDGHADLPGPLATGCITKDGTIHLTGNGRANHAGGGDPRVLAAVVNESYADYPPATHEHQGSSGAVDGNSHFYGYECENRGDGTDPWPRVQYVAMVKGTAAIIRAHRAKGDGWGLEGRSGIGHKEWSDWKPDPRGIDMHDFRLDLAACLALPAGQWEGEDDVALTDDDITRIKKAVVAELMAADVIPAVAPPDNNPDWDTNKTWSFKYAIQTPIVTVREILRRLKGVEAKVNTLSVGGVDMDALADKVADKLASRLAE